MKRFGSAWIGVLLCAALILTGCGSRSFAPSDTSSSGSSIDGSNLQNPASVPNPNGSSSTLEEISVPSGEALMLHGIRYVCTHEAPEKTQGGDAQSLVKIGTIEKVTDPPSADNEANFGAPGDVLYRNGDSYAPDDLVIYVIRDGVRHSFYPTEWKPLTRKTTAVERQFTDGVAQVASALESGDAHAIARLGQIESRESLYEGLSGTDLSVLQHIYVGCNDPYGMLYTAYLDVNVRKSSLLPIGQQRIAVVFRDDPRIPRARPELPLSQLTPLCYINSCPYEPSDADSYGWSEVANLITDRIDMPFESPADIAPQSLLLRIVVPYAYGRAVGEGKGIAVPLTPGRIADAAEILFGLKGFDVQDPNYYDASSKTYTMEHHAQVTAGMGNTMDYLDTGVNCSYDYGDHDGFRYVTVTHYMDPLQLLVGRILEYKTEKTIDELTGETIGRVLSATRIQ